MEASSPPLFDLQAFLAYFTLIASWPLGIFGSLGCLAGLALPSTRRPAAFMTGTVLTLLYSHCKLPGRKAFVDWLMSHHPRKVHKYYGAEVALRGHLDTMQPEKSLFLCHPHGVLCGGFSWNMCWNNEFHQRGGDTRFLVSTTLVNWILTFKWVAEAHGRIEGLSVQNLRKKIANGTNLCFCPGGFLEAASTAFNEDRVVPKTKCLEVTLKLAMESGSRVHPIYTFGESDTFYTLSYGLRQRLQLAKRGVPTVLGWGCFFCPLMPKLSADLLSYVGKPIDLPKISGDTATREEVSKAVDIYTQSLKALFEEFKAEAGRQESQLQIIDQDTGKTTK
eukprot:gnl/TRDRNA2_/TRDRNA2_163049_c1_seq1.p1 gnl/TRDRNA2_/TRDRNA2_163049_c1~~gnl/TRDRNA2_/TRDRNA2_163049_c1_seq1.p1  ORF type:complete len:335 (+),score=48.00 gnl/TRDRNA2_/TRDRNA2_163049_c1_seq1:84-1088(+)